MNPVLLKPGSDRRSHVVGWGSRPARSRPATSSTAGAHLGGGGVRAFDDLRSRYDLVVAEGAGSPAEINLRASDYVNMGLARHADLPIVVVGDIDRGGLFASAYGTVMLLEQADQRLVAGYVVNKFRGDVDLLAAGARRAGAAHRTADVRRPAVAPRPLARLRGRPRPRGPALGTDGPPARSPWCGCRGSATSPTSTRSGWSPALDVVFVSDAARPGGRRPGGAARDPRDAGRPGLAAVARPGPGDRRARGRRPAGARHLRRLPDAGPHDRRPARRRGGRGRRGRRAWACST